MSFSTDTTMPSYIIYRDVAEGQPLDLTAPLAFFPPKDSDELFDALRAKYPHLRTHSERTRQAVIEYLMEETQIPPMPIEQLPTPQTAASVNVSPWEASMQSMSSDSSTWSSPELFNLATPSFGMSPQPQPPALTREQSASTTLITPNASTPPALEQMTGVFSLADNAQPKQRIRRKMTEAEKAEYRKRRIVKACDKCSKRKRKCNHNQPEMENVASKSSKVTKSSPGAQVKVPAQKQQQQQQYTSFIEDADMSVFDQSFTTDVSMPSFDDFTMLPEDPLFSTNESHFSLNDNSDWALFDSGMNTMQQTVKIDTEHDPLSLLQSDYDGNMPWNYPALNATDQPRSRQQPTHTQHIHESYGLDSSDILELSSFAPMMEIQPSQQQQQRPYINAPANSAMVQREIDGNANAIGGSGRYPSLAEVTLRVNATRKAVKAFGNLLPVDSPRRSRLQNVSLRKIALLAMSGLSAAQTIAGNMPSECYAVSQTTSTLSATIAQRATHGPARTGQGALTCSACSGSFPHVSELTRHLTRCENSIVSAGGMSIGPHVYHNSRTSSGDDGDIHIPRSSSSPSHTPRYHHVTSHERSLGEGIAELKSTRTQLFMLKRRMPSTDVSEMSRATAALNPLMMAIPDATTSRGSNATTPNGLRVNTMSTAATQANGGAYPRLARPLVQSTIADFDIHGHTAAAAPVHTRPSSASNSGFEDTPHTVTTRFPHSGPSSSGGWFVNAQGSGASGVNAAGNAADGTTSAAVDKWAYRTPSENDTAVYRLSDHFRRRDHFGRSTSPSSMGALATIAALVPLLLVFSLVPADATAGTLTLVLLAMAQPTSAYEGRIHTASTPFAAQLWGTDFQWKVWNSAWAGIEEVSSRVQQTSAALRKRVRGFLSRGRPIGGRGRINSIGKKAVLMGW